MMHQTISELAGTRIKIKEGISHPQLSKFGGTEILIEDWWDRVSGGSWMFAKGNPACLVYAMRSAFSKVPVPTDDEVLYGHIGGLGHLVHINELEIKDEKEKTPCSPL